MRESKSKNLIITALMIAIVALATMFIRIPTINGYINLGDAMVYFSAFLLGKKYGALAAGLGSALGDVLGGYAIWAPWTFVIKGLMALIAGYFFEKSLDHKKIAGMPIMAYAGMVLAGLEMCLGYYIANGTIYGNWIVALGEVIPNMGQFSVGIVVSVLLVKALAKTPVKNVFKYEID
ncbi:MAG TPA: ECF transporter S component [Anaerovoracaceae bacterium]|nr:ECF transporter S component [Anaerovoracaceae bacterium]